MSDRLKATVMRRHQPVVFALVCALVLIGMSQSRAADLGSWNPVFVSAHGITTSTHHRLFISFRIPALKRNPGDPLIDPSRPNFVVCASMTHHVQDGAAPGGLGEAFSVTRCGPDELHDTYSESFMAAFYIPKTHDGKWVKASDVKIKVRVQNGPGGEYRESDYTPSARVSW